MGGADRVTRAVVITGEGAFGVAEVRLRPPSPGDVLVRIDASALCVTDLLPLDGAGLTPFPLVPGHSAVGEVLEIGADVHRVRVGDRVAVTGTAQCGRCYFCRNGSPSACVDILGGMQRVIGVDADGGPVHADGGIGTMAEHMVLRESNVVTIDADAVAVEHLATLGCGIASGLGAVLEVARVGAGDAVAVHGCGNLGLWMVQAAVRAGADPIIAIDPRPERRELARRLGATHAVDPGPDVVDQVRALTGGRGADASFEAAGRTSVMEESFASARSGGVVVPTGMESPAAAVTINGYAYALDAKRILSSQTGGGDVQRIIPAYAGLLAAGALDAASIVTRTFPLDRFDEAVAAARSRAVVTGVITMRGDRP